MQIGFVGLGKMGKNLVLHLLEQGMDVIAWNRTREVGEELLKIWDTVLKNLKTENLDAGNLKIAEDLSVLVESLSMPRIVWLMLPQGKPTDEILDQLIPLLSAGDLIVDGANSFYQDTLRRSDVLKSKNIEFMDVGVSGGPSGARQGACLMVGGSGENFQRIEQILKFMSAEGAYKHLGPTGAGHFAKMVHNGIEYGMMQAIAEGAGVLKSSDFNFKLADVFQLYNNRSVIESRLVDWAQKAFGEDENLTQISPVISHTGEGEWTVKTAEELGVDVSVIKKSYEIRVSSSKEFGNRKDIEPKDLKTEKLNNENKSNPNLFRNKVVSALRGQFGGHSVKI